MHNNETSPPRSRGTCGTSFAQQELLSDLADLLVEEGARSDVGEGSPVAEAVLSTAVHLLQWDEHAVSISLQQT